MAFTECKEIFWSTSYWSMSYWKTLTTQFATEGWKWSNSQENINFYPLIHRKVIWIDNQTIWSFSLDIVWGVHNNSLLQHVEFKSTRQNSIFMSKSQILLIFPHILTQMTPWLSKSLNFLFWRKSKQIQIFCLMIQNLHQILQFFWFFWTGNHKSRKTILPFCCNLFQVDHFSVLDWLDYFSKQFTKPSFHLCWSLWKPSTRNSSQCVKSVQIWSYF